MLLFRLALTLLGLLGCVAVALIIDEPGQKEAQTQSVIDIKPVEYKLLVTKPSIPTKTKNVKQWSPSSQKAFWPNQEVSPDHNSISFGQGNYMSLAPTGRKNAVGNPLYELRLYANGQLVGSYNTVTGRANTQNRNRHQAGTEAPLPDGRYLVSLTIVPGSKYEVGGRFLGIQPTFRTGRSALGIHYDPSFEKRNGEDGTEGCIALTNRGDLDQVLNYISTYFPQYLEVSIQ